ncbi:MAG: MarR family winged helix-turn-helix transcriptional regulator [Marmoricola sp.]
MEESRSDDGGRDLGRDAGRDVGRDVWADIEVQAAVLTRNFELLRRRRSQQLEVDRAEYLLLRTLARLGAKSIGDLADALGLDASTLGRQVGALEGAGWAERVADPADGRRAIVEMTASGRAAMRRTSKERRRRTQALLADWDEDDLRMLATMFRRYNAEVTRHYLGREGDDS